MYCIVRTVVLSSTFGKYKDAKTNNYSGNRLLWHRLIWQTAYYDKIFWSRIFITQNPPLNMTKTRLLWQNFGRFLVYFGKIRPFLVDFWENLLIFFKMFKKSDQVMQIIHLWAAKQLFIMKMYLLPSDIQNFPSFTNTAYYDKPLIMTILPGPDVVILSGFHCTVFASFCT